MKMTATYAINQAIEKGSTIDAINAEKNFQAKSVGTVPFNNMIRALTVTNGLNDKDDWTRLAAALLARKEARKGKK